MSGVVIELSGLVGSGVVVLVSGMAQLVVGVLGIVSRVTRVRLQNQTDLTPTNGMCGNRSPPMRRRIRQTNP